MNNKTKNIEKLDESSPIPYNLQKRGRPKKNINSNINQQINNSENKKILQPILNQKEIREKYKKTSIKNSNYIRPELTYTDLLTKEQIETLLIDFEEIKDINEVSIGTFIRYFEYKDDELKFRVGGILSVKRPDEGYIYLKNNQINWPVQLKNCLLFRKLTTIEVRKEFDIKFFKQEKQINELLKMIRDLETENFKLKKKLRELTNIKK
jgi:hypothetical protein